MFKDCEVVAFYELRQLSFPWICLGMKEYVPNTPQWVWQTHIYPNDSVVHGLETFVEVDANFLDGLQHFCRLQVCHLSKQQHL